MEGASFITTYNYGCARAKEIMNSESANDFRWSVRITCEENIYIGIATKFQQSYSWIEHNDGEAILYFPQSGKIYKGTNSIQGDIIAAKHEDEIHFRFQPKLKKFSISIVS